MEFKLFLNSDYMNGYDDTGHCVIAYGTEF